MKVKVCKKCGKKFSKLSLATYKAWNKRIYCSRDCYLQARKNKKVYSKCIVCEKRINIVPSKIGRTKYCSLECRDRDWKDNSPISGEKNYNWKGGTTRVQGYIYQKKPKHPFCNGGGYVMQHRLVMEKKIGRYLTTNEEVHHRNGIKDDNRIENLEIVVKNKHFGVIKCPHCLKKFKIK